MNALLEIEGSEGVIISEPYTHEKAAHEAFERLERIKNPGTYKKLVMNLSEWDDERTIGAVRVVALDEKGKRYVRRELYRKP